MPGTLLPLETWRQLVGYHPWYFWQLANSKIPISTRANGIIREYEWQKADYISRAEIREGIATAERRLLDYLGYSVAPHWVTETIDLGCQVSNCFDSKLIKLAEGKLIQVATQNWELLGTAAPAYSDADLDGLDETFTVENADTDNDPDDVALFFATSDRLVGTETDIERWKIAPVTITRKDAATLKATGKKYLLVKPIKYEAIGAVPGYDASMTGGDSSGAYDPDVAGNFVSNVAFYKSTLTNANKATLVYDQAGTTTNYTVNVTMCNKESGLVQVGLTSGQNVPCTCGCSCECWAGCGSCGSGCATQATRIEISYQAGASLDDCQTIIARMACAEITRSMQDSNGLVRGVARWQKDMAQVSSGSGGGQFESYRIDNDDLGNPLGTRAGQIYAWKQIKNLRLLRGVSI